MKLTDLKNLSGDDLLDVLGLQKRTSTPAAALEAVGLFGAGVIVGAAVALLLAPKSGRELRDDLNQKIRAVRPLGRDITEAPTIT